jgi:hypothetical protein
LEFIEKEYGQVERAFEKITYGGNKWIQCILTVTDN